MAYWDTSCLLKLYAPEADSPEVESYLLTGATIVTSEIARFELWATLRRKQAVGELKTGGAREALNAYDADIASGLIVVNLIDSAVIAIFDAVVEHCNGRTPSLPIRTLDAIHLATAQVSGEPVLVATDKRLRDAAASFGFKLSPAR